MSRGELDGEQNLFEDDRNPINDTLLGRKRRSAPTVEGYDPSLID